MDSPHNFAMKAESQQSLNTPVRNLENFQMPKKRAAPNWQLSRNLHGDVPRSRTHRGCELEQRPFPGRNSRAALATIDSPKVKIGDDFLHCEIFWKKLFSGKLNNLSRSGLSWLADSSQAFRNTPEFLSSSR